MNLIKNSIFIFCLLLITIPFLACRVSAQNSLALTITPPLIKINMNPGGEWSSSIKVVNDNPGTLIVYADTLDFKSGEEGGVEFIQKSDIKENQKFLLSQWIEIDQKPIVISGFQSKEVPFIIKDPQDAEPGGHYAAILIGTKPPRQVQGTGIRIASQISSLILLNIQGEIEEKGWIREFSTDKNFYQMPEVGFKFSFENLGNVHLQPVGEIKIYNMWNKERGIIPINYKTAFGNVLPQSKRVWNFEWRGEPDSFEIGRYRADLVLVFGDKAHQTATSTVYFWIIPLVPVIGLLGGFFIFFLILILGIRLYIRKAVIIAQKEAGLIIPYSPEKEKTTVFGKIGKIKLTPKVLKGPITEAIVDLRSIVAKKEGIKTENKIQRLGFLLRKYYKFTLFSLIVILWGMAISFYIEDTLKFEKSFEVVRKEEGKEIIISSEEIFKSEEISSNQEVKEEESKQPSTSTEFEKSSISLEILNGSGIPRAAAKVAILLEDNGFYVAKLGNADSFNYNQTVIKYKNGKETEANALNRLLGGLSVLEEVEYQVEDIVIIIGKDFQESKLF
jgi:hypothetical protein